MEYNYAERMNVFGKSPIREVLKLARDPEVISLAAGNPSPQSFPVNEIKEILNRLLTEQPELMLQYGVSEGYAPLQAAIRERMSRKYQTGGEDDGILITSGAQQGIELFSKTFLNDGDVVLCETPSFISALNAIRSYNDARVVGIPMDEEGMDMEALERALKTEKNVKFIYTISTFQNPMGVTLSLERRKQMLALAKEYGVMILEDAPYFELRYSGEAIPTIKSLDKDGIVTFVGSLSKVIAPGIRVGYLLGPKDVIKTVTRCKQISDVHTNTLMQALCCAYIKDYDMDGHIEKIVDMYRRKRDCMLEELEKFDRRIAYTKPDGGMFLWVRMPEGYDAEELLDRVWDKGKVIMISGPAFAVRPGEFQNCFRLNFSMPDEETIRKGMGIIKTCLDDYLE